MGIIFLLKTFFFSYFIITFLEWFIHKHIMHGDERTLRNVPFVGKFLYKTALNHKNHHEEVDNKMKLAKEYSFGSLYFKWGELGIFYVLFASLLFLFLGPLNLVFVMIYSFVVISIYVFLWNTWHIDMHDVDDVVDIKTGIPNFSKAISYGPIYRWLWKNHAIHHMQKLDKCNFNIIVPGFDFIMQTYNNAFDNRQFCIENYSARVCGNKSKIYGKFTNVDIHPTQ